MKITAYFRQEPRFAWTVLGVLLAGLAGIGDRTLAGGALLLDVFFLLPIGLASWNAGTGGGASVAVASALVWSVAELASPVDTITRLLFFLMLPVLLPAVRRERDHERESGQTDYLTRTASKWGFQVLAGMEVQRSQRYKRPFTVAAMDINQFHRINEQFGHHAADNLLRSVARTLKEKVRSSDLVARLGNDEFALFFPETQSEAAQIVLPRLQKCLLDVAERNEWPVTFSIGAITYLQAPESVDAMLKKVADLVEAVKAGGRNSIRHEVVGSVGVS